MHHESSQFSKYLNCFHKSNKSSRIFSTIAQNKSLKIQIRKPRILTNLDLQTCKSRFVSPIHKDLVREFVLEKKIPKLLDLYPFVRICPRKTNHKVAFNINIHVWSTCV